jgi:transcriptional regulator GlxA family with amidase domain
MYSAPLLYAASENQLWYLLPLVVAVSLVWSATRHEDMRLILRRALRSGLTILGLLAAAFVLLYLISRWL